ncbi:PAS domain S-box protein [Deltaproteobacteria bacterium TL4]
MKIHTKLSNVLTFNFVLVATLPILIIGIVTLESLSLSLEKEINAKHYLLAKSLNGEVKKFLKEPMSLLKQIQDIVDEKNLIPFSQIDTYLNSVHKNYPFFDGIEILDQEGVVRHLATQNKNFLGYSRSGQPFFRHTHEFRAPYWSPTFISTQTDQPTLTLSVPLKQGMVVGYLNLESLNSMTDQVKIGLRGYATIVDRGGITIAHPNRSFISERLNVANLNMIQRGFAGKEGNSRYDFNGVDWLGSVIIVPQTGWLIVVTQPLEEAFAPVIKIRRIIWTGIVAALVLAITISLLSLRKTLKPFSELTESSKKIAAGNYGFVSPKSSYREIDDLATAFEVMSEAVKNREEALSKSEEQYRQLFQNSIAALTYQQLMTDDSGRPVDYRLLEVNNAFETMSGFKKADVVGKTIRELYPGQEESFYHVAPYGKVALSDESLRFEDYFKATEKWYSVSAFSPQRGFFVTSFDDITERKRAESALLESEENLRTILNSIGDAVIATDLRGNITLINPIAQKLTGWEFENSAGKPLTEIFKIVHAQTRQVAENPVAKVMATGKISGLANHTLLISKEGTEYQIADSAAPIENVDGEISGVVLVFRDVTEKYKIEEELFNAKKLESVGVLAGGIAHDFNNILTGLFGHIGLAKLKLPPDHAAYIYLETANRALTRATNLTKQLLTFAKGGDPLLEAVNVKQVIQESIDFSLSGSKVKTDLTLPEDLWQVKADKGQLSQIIANLTINAEQAMPEGGTLHIDAENIKDLKENLASHLSGDFVKLRIRDEGIGIPTKNIGKIFDPYFTTKRTGSGLGLATVHHIILKHNGHISVDSKPGMGTTFTVYFPADVSSQTTTTPISASVSDDLTAASGHILVMDDEVLIRTLSVELLESYGYTAVAAVDGTESLEKYSSAAKAGQPFDIVIMDLTIPGGMGGKETIKKLLTLDPNAKVIVSSGYSSDPIMANYSAYGFKGRIVKPFMVEDLKKELVRVMALG